MRLSFQYMSFVTPKVTSLGVMMFQIFDIPPLRETFLLRWERSNLFQCNTNNCMTNALVFLCSIFSYDLPKKSTPPIILRTLSIVVIMDRDIFCGICTISVGIFGNYFLQSKFANSNSCSSLRTKTKNLWLRLMMRCSSFLTVLNAKFHKYFIQVENFIRQ